MQPQTDYDFIFCSVEDLTATTDLKAEAVDDVQRLVEGSAELSLLPSASSLTESAPRCQLTDADRQRKQGKESRHVQQPNRMQ